MQMNSLYKNDENHWQRQRKDKQWDKMRDEEVVTLEPARQRDFTVIKNIYDHKKVGDILTTAECKMGLM